ncbi:MAG: tRNA (N6-threonylcarbamoyladenosine(37)-N6)-methyltransferase TrmO [Proteobacteria bacterium]|nr:tRNA (N6-threonylcarbamoyladenosine(37)-N6)-methyltransferase TrmO [Pseudomonadota bacterium]
MERPMPKALRPGELALADNPANGAGDAHLVFIGRVRSAWTQDRPHPKNPTEAREKGGAARLEVLPPFRPGLRSLERFSHVVVLAWLDRARRDPIVIQPPHADEPRGVFSLRSPVRPNPIGLSVARILKVDHEAGVVEIDAIDFLDGTPLVDIKPYRPGIDAIPDAVVG